MNAPASFNPRAFASALAILALALPPPVTATGKDITLALCGGTGGTVTIPGKPALPDNHDCCGKACHAGCERKRKAAGEDQNDDEPDE